MFKYSFCIMNYNKIDEFLLQGLMFNSFNPFITRQQTFTFSSFPIIAQ